jgi:hypothetical protein
VWRDFATHPDSKKFARRLAAARAARPALVREASRRVLDHYRAHRTLPPGLAARLLTGRALARLVAQGEIEHWLRLSKLLLAAQQARRRLAAFLRIA